MRQLTIVLFAAAWLAAPLAAASPCQGGTPEVGWLGITGLSDTKILFVSGFHYWFQQEPRIDEVAGPARGKLRPGDVVTAVDGYFVTTRRGSRRLVEVEPGEVVTLGVQRDGEPRDVEIRAAAICPEDLPRWLSPPEPPVAPVPPAAPAAPAVLAVPAPPAVPVAPAPPAPPAAPTAPVLAPLPPLPATEAWFGFGFVCDKCGMKDDLFYFTSPPRVYSVEPDGPAAEAGLERGDVMTHVDGEPLTSEAGAERFSRARPGTRLRLTYRRGGEERETVMLGQPRPRLAARAEIAKLRAELAQIRTGSAEELLEQARELSARLAAEAGAPRLRYAGTLGSTDVEVRGLDSVHVTVDEERGTLSIRTLDATIHLSLAPERKDGAP